MKLQTKVDIESPKCLISHKSSLLLVGSCFTENIGALLTDYKFPTLINSCGIAYNPVSVANTLAFITEDKTLSESDFVFHNAKWHSLHHHGRFSEVEKADLKKNITNELNIAKKRLSEFSHIFLTLGTVWVFEHLKTQQIVNNCHKIPSKAFRRRRLSLNETIATLKTAIEQIRKYNSTAEIIFTVSPVRHLKDGLHENQLSKATLLLAISELQKQCENIGYFPAYEIATDELRDYRFFTEDFCHLNDLGVQYIWERFAESYISMESRKYFPDLQKLQKALSHKVQDVDSENYAKFREKVATQIMALEKHLPMIDFSEEKSRFS